MQFIPLLLTVATVHFLAVASPGPDFVMILRNSLMYSRRTGIYSALGLGLGILVHVTYCLVGIAIVISRTPILFTIIQIVGAVYLIYIGYQSVVAKSPHTDVTVKHSDHDLSAFAAIRVGFLTNVLNPKVTLFFLSLFTVVITPETPLYIKVIMGIEMSIVTFLWFAFVTLILSHRHVKSRIDGIQHYATKIMGAILIVLGVALVISSVIKIHG